VTSGHQEQANSARKVVHRRRLIQRERPNMSHPWGCMRLMKRGGWATDEHLLRQHSKNSVIRTSVLRKMGVGAKTIVDRTAGGPWQRILPGLVLLHNGPPTWTQRVTAAVMYGGGEAMLTGRAGLALHGYSTSAHHSQTMLLIPHGSHRKDTSFVSVERTWRLPGAVRKSGLSVAPLDRCLLDAADSAPWRGVVRIGEPSGS